MGGARTPLPDYDEVETDFDVAGAARWMAGVHGWEELRLTRSLSAAMNYGQEC